jgi:hypothetical protein
MALQSTTALATITLQLAASEVAFSSIPNTYRDLVLVVSAANTMNDITWSMRINGDSGANYNYVLARGKSIAPITESQAAASQTSMFIAGWSFGQGTTNQTPLVIQFMDYSATDKHKTLLNRFQTQRNDGGNEVGMLTGRWASSAAISSITLFPNSSTFAVGSTFSLYGRIA